MRKKKKINNRRRIIDIRLNKRRKILESNLIGNEIRLYGFDEKNLKILYNIMKVEKINVL